MVKREHVSYMPYTMRLRQASPSIDVGRLAIEMSGDAAITLIDIFMRGGFRENENMPPVNIYVIMMSNFRRVKG